MVMHFPNLSCLIPSTLSWSMHRRYGFPLLPCIYWLIEIWLEVWENKKCGGNASRRRVFSQLFWVLPNFHRCFYNLIETRRTCFLFLSENIAVNKRKKLVGFDYQNLDSLCLCHHYVIHCWLSTVLVLSHHRVINIIFNQSVCDIS